MQLNLITKELEQLGFERIKPNYKGLFYAQILSIYIRLDVRFSKDEIGDYFIVVLYDTDDDKIVDISRKCYYKYCSDKDVKDLFLDLKKFIISFKNIF